MSTKKQATDTFSHLPFKDLKKLIKKREAEPSKTLSPAEKKEKMVNDEELFLNAMREVEEIREFREIAVNQRKVEPVCRKTSSDEDVLKALEEIGTGSGAFHLPDTQEYLEWVNEGYRAGIIGRLHKGHYAVSDYIDLHGLILEDAEKEVDSFIKDSLSKGHQCIKIIHGRGLRSPDGPVLKKAVVKWLLSRYRKYIIAFVTARQCDGGLGAIYVLFK